MEELQEEIRKFESGAVRGSEKGKEDFIEGLSWTALRRYCFYMTSKREQYGRKGSFKLGIEKSAYLRSALRHISKYIINNQEEGSLEPDEDHLSAIVFNIMGLMHEEEREKRLSKKSLD